MVHHPQLRKLSVAPSGLDHAAFVERFGGVYEDSPWVAEAVWAGGLQPIHDTVDGLAKAMAGAVAGAPRSQRLALIRAHPDLAGRAAVAGTLTASSRAEQAGAGLDQCSREEFERFQTLNAAYREKFGFPFVVAVTGLDRAAILAAFEARLGHDAEREFAAALHEIDKIALIRLSAM